jgi:hypothetical protein
MIGEVSPIRSPEKRRHISVACTTIGNQKDRKHHNLSFCESHVAADIVRGERQRRARY